MFVVGRNHDFTGRIHGPVNSCHSTDNMSIPSIIERRNPIYSSDSLSLKDVIKAEKKASQLIDILKTGIDSGFDENIIFDIRGKKYNFPVRNLYGLGIGNAVADGYACDVFAVGYSYPNNNNEPIIVQHVPADDKLRFFICRQLIQRITKYIKTLQEVVIEITQTRNYENTAVFKNAVISSKRVTINDICGNNKPSARKKNK